MVFLEQTPLKSGTCSGIFIDHQITRLIIFLKLHSLSSFLGAQFFFNINLFFEI